MHKRNVHAGKCRFITGCKDALLAGKEKEESTIGKQILEQLEKNLEIAKESQIPICQDTGMTVVFLRIGQEVHIDGDFWKMQ